VSSSICAVADPQEKWWTRLRGNPKRSGEISQAAFLLRAEMMGYDLALPWGDNQGFDFMVRGRDGQAVRVQVKGTGRLHRRGYEVQPVRATRRGGKKRYTKKDIDVIAAHVQPVDAWYLIPIEKIGRAKSLRLYPDIESRARGNVEAAGPARAAVGAVAGCVGGVGGDIVQAYGRVFQGSSACPATESRCLRISLGSMLSAEPRPPLFESIHDKSHPAQDMALKNTYFCDFSGSRRTRLTSVRPRCALAA
jgi:hypothetical protein